MYMYIVQTVHHVVASYKQLDLYDNSSHKTTDDFILFKQHANGMY